MDNPNFLILDEPTNDLDIFVLSVLEDYLRNFPGCLIVVSHDRYFMDKMVDHIFVMNGDGKINNIIGNYTAFREEEKQAKKEKQNKKVVAIAPRSENKKEKNKLNFKEKEEFKEIEKEIEKLEIQKNEITNQLANPSKTGEELNEMGKELSLIVHKLEEKTNRWFELSEFM